LVEDREVGRETECPAVEPEESIAHRMEGPAPHAPGVVLLGEPFGARQHLSGAPTAEREEEDPFGPRPTLDQRGDPGRQGHRLPAAGPGHDEERPLAVTDGGLLLRGQLLEHAFEG
jgi:hypothetical protein